MKPVKLASLFLVGVVGLAACSDHPTPLAPGDTVLSTAATANASAGRYLVMFKGNTVPSDFASVVQGLGGSVTFEDGRIGVAAVTGLSDEAATKLRSQGEVQGVAEDTDIQWDAPKQEFAGDDFGSFQPTSSSSPASAAYYARQWNMRVIGADQAWAAGHRGSSRVTVAILDTGIDPTHPDLVGRVDMNRSRSFVPATDAALANAFYPGAPDWTDLNGHGTHVGATVSSNAVHAAGVTSEVTLMAVKVLGVTGSPWSGLTQGIMYAADSGADVINMSLGASFPRTKNGQFITQYLTRAVTYAFRNGVTVVVSAGNSAIDLDHDKNGYKAFCSAPTVMCVSATGPTDSNWGVWNGPFPNVDALAIYSNFGRSAIGVAAPGGNYQFTAVGPNAPLGYTAGWVWAACSGTKLGVSSGQRVRVPCNPTTRLSGFVGTSMASPHVAGLAALMVEKYGKNPGRIQTAIQQSADDLGQPGTDAAYGKGRINVAKALGL